MMPAVRPTPAKAVGPRLRILLVLLLACFVLLAVNAAYLGGVTLMEWHTGQTYQNYGYQLMFLFHLLLGLLVVLPTLVFMALHTRNTWRRKNRRAVYAGLGLLAAVLALLLSGVVLVRFEGFALNQQAWRNLAYWTHVLVPLLFSEAVNLHPVAIVLAVLFFGGIWGLWGVFFAIPLATLIKAIINAWPTSATPVVSTAERHNPN